MGVSTDPPCRASVGVMMTVVGIPRDALGAAGLEALYAAEYRSLVRLASLLVDDVETAEEVVQDAFVRAALRRLDDADKAVPYLRSCVLNGARSVLRRRRVAAAFRWELAGEARAAETVALDHDRHDRMVGALRRLPARQRECLVLRYYGDLSEADIASSLGISAGSVKTHCHRGLQALAALVEEDR